VLISLSILTKVQEILKKLFEYFRKMRVTIYAGSFNREYIRHFSYLEKIKKIDKISYYGTNPLYYTYSKLRNFKSYNFKQIFDSYLAPIRMFFSKDVLVISFPPYSYKALLPLLLARLKKKIIFFHSWPYWNNKNDYIIKPNKLKIKIWNKFLSSTVSIIVNSTGVEALRNLDCKAYLIPHCIDAKLFNLKKTDNKKIKILYVGRLIEEKGIRDLLEVSSKFDPTKIQFVFVGEGKLKNYILSKQKELQISYLGYVEDKEKLAEIYTQSDIFVLNSYKIPKWEEFFGIVLIEAMASGLPIVSTDCVGPKDIITNGKDGFLIKQRSKEELYNALKKLINDKKLRMEMGRNGREKAAKNYSVENVAEKLFNILNSI